MKHQIIELLTEILTSLGYDGVIPEVSRPENPAHGDYSTNVAMVIAGQKKESPIDITNRIKKILDDQKASIGKEMGSQNRTQKGQTISDFQGLKGDKFPLSDIEKVVIVPPGFINIFISEARLSTLALGLPFSKDSATIGQKDKKKKIMVEFAHPNTHKAFHIGHLRNITTGESIVRLLEAVGNTVIRVNYQGDVGLHIAKALWGILSSPSSPSSSSSLSDRIDSLARAYVVGAKAYDAESAAKAKIERINNQIYAKDPKIYPLYEKTRQWSLDYFDQIYKRVGTHFDRFYFESEVYESGKKLVEEGIHKGIFEKSDGAVIFPGKKFGLHNRVFITRDGNATYEGKDMGLGKLQFSEYHPDFVIHCVSSEQTGYFQVIIEALAQLLPETKGKEYHLVYGWVKLKEGKMSSRTGQVVLGEWLIDTVKKEIHNIVIRSISKDNDSKHALSYSSKEIDEIAEAGAVAAVKYSFLKVGTRQEIAFDIKESVNLNGDSGPYLLYTYARCRSVLRKASEQPSDIQGLALNSEEHALARLLLYFPEIVVEAAQNYAPNILCTYLFTLAQAFNLFYQKCPILKHPYRLQLTDATARVLKKGLYLLGITTLERM